MSCQNQTVNVPGVAGANGAAGANGTNGSNAFSSISEGGVVIPAYGGTATVALANPPGSLWIGQGQTLYVQSVGFFRVDAIPDNDHVTLFNLGYTGNVNGDGLLEFPAGARVSPGGLEGPAGALSGAAGGDLAGTYPNPTLAAIVAAGSAGDATNIPQITIDTKGRVTALTSVPATYPSAILSGSAAGGDLTGTYPNPTLAASGVVATTYGTPERHPSLTIDAKGRVTVAALMQPRYGVLGKVTGLQLNPAGPGTDVASIPMLSSRYIVRRIILENASVNLTTATLGIFRSAGGINPLAADQVLTALTNSSKFLDLTLSGIGTTDVHTAANLIARVGTPQGGAATANLWIFGESVE